jgi:hypothetical protein
MSQHGEAGAQGHARPVHGDAISDRDSSSTSSAPTAEQHSESEWDRMWRKPFDYPEGST